MILGVIPARGGSKRIPKKNLHPLNGIPLIQYTYVEAMNSRLDMVIISTDDEEIAKQGASLMRPDLLAQDDTPTLPVIQHAMEGYERLSGAKVDAVMILQPTSPLRTTYDIDNALNAFLNNDNDSLISVCQGVHPVKLYDELGTPLYHEQTYNKHKHQCLQRNGAIFIVRRDLLDQGRLIGDKPLLYLMPKSRSIDIDDYDDLHIAEALLKRGDIN